MLKKTVIVLGFSFSIWAFCGALVGVGGQFMSMDATVIVHAIGAPMGAALRSWLYFRNYGFTSPLVTAVLSGRTGLGATDLRVRLPLAGAWSLARTATPS